MRLLLARILTVSSSSNREETTAENSGKFAFTKLINSKLINKVV